jgi:hypothetical protein
VTFTAGRFGIRAESAAVAGDRHGRGAAAVCACNFVYLSVLPMMGDPAATTIAGRGIQYASEDRVATAVMEQAFAGYGAKLMAAAILVSTFGCVNGMLLAGARVYYAMSRDGLFFKSRGAAERSAVTRDAGELAVGAVGVDVRCLCLSGQLWAACWTM